MDETTPGTHLDALRARLDGIDDRLVEALAARLRAAAEVGAVKGSAGMAAWDPVREAEVVRRAAVAARAQGVPEEAVRQVFWTILGHCREAVAHGSRQRGAAPPAGCGT